MVTPRFSIKDKDFVPDAIKKKNRRALNQRAVNGHSLDVSLNRYRNNLGLDGNKEDIFLE